ncbi:Hypothetical predicted protein, partial [Pelobates cultripes]
CQGELLQSSSKPPRRHPTPPPLPTNRGIHCLPLQVDHAGLTSGANQNPSTISGMASIETGSARPPTLIYAPHCT